MEKMDSEKICDHIKCYANTALMSHPLQRPWICELCGEEGQDAERCGVVIGRYEQLQEKKKRGEFKPL